MKKALIRILVGILALAVVMFFVIGIAISAAPQSDIDCHIGEIAGPDGCIPVFITGDADCLRGALAGPGGCVPVFVPKSDADCYFGAIAGPGGCVLVVVGFVVHVALQNEDSGDNDCYDITMGLKSFLDEPFDPFNPDPLSGYTFDLVYDPSRCR